MREEPTATVGLSEARDGNPAQDEHERSLSTHRLEVRHRTADFVCSKSERIHKFFDVEAPVLIPAKFCRVFVSEDRNDTNRIQGFYSLSATLLFKDSLSGGDERYISKECFGFPVPMVRIGFMGRDDNSEPGLGAGLLMDAAIRVHTNRDIAVWGLTLESEGGPEANPKLWNWYLEKGFKPCRKQTSPLKNTLYAPLSKFLPA